MKFICSILYTKKSPDPESSITRFTISPPHRLIDELVRHGQKGRTVIANDTARRGFGIGKLIDAKLVKGVSVYNAAYVRVRADWRRTRS